MTGRKIGLDYVRAVAILCVLLSHTLATFTGFPRRYYFSLGTAGVEIFFVLSGYLIGGIFLKSIAQQGGITVPLVRLFWVRRWLRTIPNYLLFILIWGIAQRSQFDSRVWRFLVFDQNLFVGTHLGFFEVSWSLAVEEWFYLLLPILSLLAYQVLRRPSPAVFVTVLILFVGPFVLRMAMASGRGWDADIRKVVIFRLDALMWGVILAAAERFRNSSFKRMQHPALLASGLLAVAVAFVWDATSYPTPHSNDFRATPLNVNILTLYSLGCTLLMPFAGGYARHHRLLDAVVTRISLWSYSMYLCHVPIFWSAIWLVDKSHRHVPRLISMPLIWMSVFGLSCLLYHCVELPFLRLRDGWTAARNKPRVTDTDPVEAVPSLSTASRPTESPTSISR